jgi:hypothetical protein
MKVYIIGHTCVHALVDGIAVRVDGPITSVGVYEGRITPQVGSCIYCARAIPKEPALIPSDKSAPCQNSDAPHKKTTDNSCTGNAPKNT